MPGLIQIWLNAALKLGEDAKDARFTVAICGRSHVVATIRALQPTPRASLVAPYGHRHGYNSRFEESPQ